MAKKPSRYNKLLFWGLILSAILEIGGFLFLAVVDWRICFGAFMLYYAMNLKKVNRGYEYF